MTQFSNLKDIKILEKAAQEGVYADTYQNRKLGRVGMTYAGYKKKIEKKESEEVNALGVSMSDNIKELNSLNKKKVELLKKYKAEKDPQKKKALSKEYSEAKGKSVHLKINILNQAQKVINSSEELKNMPESKVDKVAKYSGFDKKIKNYNKLSADRKKQELISHYTESSEAYDSNNKGSIKEVAFDMESIFEDALEDSI